MRSTGKTGTSQRSTGSPAGRKDPVHCRSIRPDPDHRRQLQLGLGRHCAEPSDLFWQAPLGGHPLYPHVRRLISSLDF